MYPQFTYLPLTRTSYRVVDAHTGEEYGTVRAGVAHAYWVAEGTDPECFITRTEAAEAVYRARHAHGFEAGVL